MSTIPVEAKESLAISTSRNCDSKNSPYEWVVAICAANFDLRLGPRPEYLVPESGHPFVFSKNDPNEGDSLSPNVLATSCAIAFPESSKVVHSIDTVFTFKLDVSKGDLADINSTTNSNRTEDTNSPPSDSDGKESRGASEFLYGYVHFVQKPDSTNPRGFFQKAVIVYSKYALPGLFHDVVRRISEGYHSFGSACLDAAWIDISTWPTFESVYDKINSSGEIQLPILGDLLKVNLPFKVFYQYSYKIDNKVQLTRIPRPLVSYHISNRIEDSHGSFWEINLFVLLGPRLLPLLWNFWELVLCGEPILIMSSSPHVVSQVAFGLASLIQPIGYMGEIYPYLTIYDQNFNILSVKASKSDGLSSVIVGATNPFFFKEMKMFPNIICVSDYPYDSEIVSRKCMETGVAKNIEVDTSIMQGSAERFGTTIVPPRSPDMNKSLSEVGSKLLLDDSCFNESQYNTKDLDQDGNSPQSESMNTTTSFSEVSSTEAPTKKPESASVLDDIDDEKSYGKHMVQLFSPVSRKKLDDFTRIFSEPSFFVSDYSSKVLCNPSLLNRFLSSHSKLPDGKKNKHVDFASEPELAVINNLVLRRHFKELTAAFLLPFQPYINPNPDLMAQSLQPTFNPYLHTPQLPSFSKEALLASINEKACQPLLSYLIVRGRAGRKRRLVDLYSRFMSSPHFSPWLQKCREEAKEIIDHITEKAILALYDKCSPHRSRLYDLLDGAKLSDVLYMLAVATHTVHMAKEKDHAQLFEAASLHLSEIEAASKLCLTDSAHPPESSRHGKIPFSQKNMSGKGDKLNTLVSRAQKLDISFVENHFQ